MDQGNAIEVRNVCKAFRLYKDKGHSLKEKVLFKERNAYDTRTVLKNISFEVKKGEAVGLIGHNGCGKSTTLKLLTKIIYPDSGEIIVKGRVSSLLELGAGFHPDMSGRDNIYINASIFGLSRKEIDERLDEIIGFSELGSYIDNPVRTYSSGMYMRLAFSVAINVNADVIMVDEILSVGDLNFQAKCMKKLMEIKASGTTIIIVSHSLQQIESICDRSIWLNDGTIVMDGEPGAVHREYLEFMGSYSFEDSAASDEEKQEIEQRKKEMAEAEAVRKRYERGGSGEVRIGDICLTNEKGEEQTVFSTGEKIRMKLDLCVDQTKDVNIYFGILRTDYMLCYGTSYFDDKREFIHACKDSLPVTVEFPDLGLLPSRYMIDIRVYGTDGEEVDIFNEAAEFFVYSDTKESGMIRLNHMWQINMT